MRYRIAELTAPRTIGAAGTEVIDIKNRDPISRLFIAAEIQDKINDPSEHPWSTISKIEIVDGSEVIYELTGRMANALDYYDSLMSPRQRLAYVDDFYPRINASLWFGRYLYDRELAFDPTKFRNPQLRITWNADEVFAGATDIELSIFADVFDPRLPSPGGYLRSQEVYSFTLADDSYEYINLPTNHTLRKLLVTARNPAQYWYTTINGFKLDIDNGAYIPFDLDAREVERMIERLYPYYEERVRHEVDPGSTAVYCTPYDRVSAGILSEEDQNVYNNTDDNVGGQVLLTPENDADKVWVNIRGILPQGCACFPFGNPGDPDDWFDVGGINNIELRLLGGSSTAGAHTARVGIQEYVRY